MKATVPDKDIAKRQTNTWSSSVFHDNGNNQQRERQNNTYNSSVFAEALHNRVTRTKLETGDSHGTGALFGDSKTEFNRSSANGFINAPPAGTSKKIAETKANPVMTTMQRKANELYGETVNKFAMNNNKRDGALMAQGADWRCSNARAIETESPMKNNGKLDTKDRLY